MLFLDVNVLVAAHRPESAPEWPKVERWLDGAVLGHESLGVAELVVSGFVRVVTNVRAFRLPSQPSQAVEFGTALLSAPATSVVRPGPRHWDIFADLVTTHRLRGNDVPDAYLAAVALERGATMVTMDRGFARFDGLRVLDPSSA